MEAMTNRGDEVIALELAATLSFFREMDRLKSVERKNFLADGSRRENTAEHSWHLGMAVLALAPFAEEPVDTERALAMALAHDIVEIDAGDTFAYDQGAEAESKRAREEAAADRLFGLLPAERGTYLRGLWDEYEEGLTAEARFVMAVDRMAPMLLNLAEGGTTWREYGITADRVEERNRRHIEPVLPGVWAAAADLLAEAVRDGRLSPSSHATPSSPGVHPGPAAASPALGTVDVVSTISTDPSLDVPSIDTATSDPRRLVVLEAVHNFRDLGGYPTASGQVTRWGRLFRADGLYRLSNNDVDIVRSLGLRTVVDLRTHEELDERGVFPRDRITVRFTHVPVIDATWNHDAPAEHDSDRAFLVWAYREMLAVGAQRFAEAFEELARPGALPAVFHCAAGKDRTGLLAAMILGSLDVPLEYVIADYGLTAAGMVRMREWALREFPDMAERMGDTPSAFLQALPEAMSDVLDDLVVQHGSIGGYVRSIGVSDEAIASIAAELLTDAG